jgi:hypothetical protein
MTDETKVLSRADFVAATTLKRELVPVAELGGAVYMQELYAAQILDFNEFVAALKKKGRKEVTPSTSLELMARLVSLSACDANGKPLFTENDVKQLAKSNLAVLITLSAKAMELSGLSSRALEEVIVNLKKAKGPRKGSAST